MLKHDLSRFEAGSKHTNTSPSFWRQWMVPVR